MKYVFLLAFLFSVSSFGTITDFSASNYSNFLEKNGVPYIYGGIAGNACAGTTPCNSCDGSAAVACNTARITPSMNLQVTFKSTESGQACAAKTVSGTVTPYPSTIVSYTAGNTVTLSIPWSQLCTDTTPSMGSCTGTTGGQLSLDVGVDKDNGGCVTMEDKKSVFVVVAGLPDSATGEVGGIENFVAYPGDEKVSLTSIQGVFDPYSPARSFANVSAVGAYYREGDCTVVNTITNAIISGNNPYFTEVSAEGILQDERIRDLVNGQQYVFQMVARDEANNIGLFTDMTGCDDNVHTATPDTVYGILENKQNCFIATAAFGSILDPHVQTFRDFRDEFLTTSLLGKKFVHFYYQNSPPLADFISKHEYLRRATQAFLFPFLGLALMYLYMGPVAANLVLIVLGGIIVLAIHNRKKRATA